MKKNILLRTNILVCIVIVAGFLLTALLSYRANYDSSLQNIEQMSTLTSEGIYYQITTAFTRPINVSLTMANDSLLKQFLTEEQGHLEDEEYIATLSEYLGAYRIKYGYDSVFLVSTATRRYYNFNGLDRVLEPDNPENVWYYHMLEIPDDYAMQVDNDEVAGAENEITVFVNCKIRDERNEILGIVGVGLRIQNLQALLQGYQDKFGVNACLIDNEGVIEISTDYTGYENVNLFEIDRFGTDVQRNILDWVSETEERSFWAHDQHSQENKNYIVTRYLSELNWHLVVEQDTDTLLSTLRRQMALTMSILLLIITIILLVITHVIRSFNRRIVELTREREQERRTMFEKVTNQLYENIYELDITNNCPANRVTEEYFESLGAPHGTPYNKALQMIAEKQIKEEHRQGYLDMFLPEKVLQAYGEGKETLQYEFMISQDGENYHWIRITARIVPWESDGTLHMLVYRQNVDAEKEREMQMQELAQTDEMTGLLTKTATERCVGDVLRREGDGSFAFFIFDIDNFKQANDRYGHAFGDEVIREFADIIRGQFRKGDTIGRIGGDEFAVFIRASDRSWVEEKARKLSVSLCRTFCSGRKCWQMSGSIGVVFAPADGSSFDTYYRHADEALYVTKKKGKNGFTMYRDNM